MKFSELAPGPGPQLPLEAYQKRRERLGEQLDAPLLVATHQEFHYSNDVEPRFRPHSDFWYLTGFDEPQSALLLDETGRSRLFCRTRDPKAEVWTGRRLGLDRAKDALGVDEVHPFDELSAYLKRLDASKLYTDTKHFRQVHNAANRGETEDGARLIAEMRLFKEPAEIDMLRKACDVGSDAMRACFDRVAPGATEYQVEAALLEHYRNAGSTGPGYPAIVGTGANAAILHYIENKATIKSGEMVLIDAGCEWGYYNSDITRTVPADGEFSNDHAKLYELVHAAQQAAMAKVQPGNLLTDVHEAASRVLAAGFIELGWLEGDEEVVLESGEHRRFFMHGTSHFLGLDVHDVGRYKDDGKSRKLEPGMVITVEPGLYLNPDFTEIPAGLDPLGIRIENDVVVTDEGPMDLVAGLPTSIDGIQGILQK